MKDLVIPEDQELDQYIVVPVVERIFDELGCTARVFVLPEPRLRGASQALDPAMIAAIVRDNSMVDLFVLVVDADCERQHHSDKARAREAEHVGKLLACVAVQEIEVWMLALYKSKLDAPFGEVRAECDPKERFADPLLDSLGRNGPGAGRKRAMRALAGSWQSVRDTCPELRELRDRIATWRAGREAS